MTTKTLSVYDPAMCCSSGVCGPDVDPNLAKFSADLSWLAEQGVEVKRFNLAQQPGAFVAESSVKGALESTGEGALPMLISDGRTLMSGAYPTRDQLAGWFGLTPNAPKTTACCTPKSGCC
jgi:hypothetical protein